MSSDLSLYLRNLDVYAIGADTLTYPSKWLLNIFGYTPVITERIIAIPGFRGIIIHAPCMGFNVFSIFIALIIAFPVNAGINKKTAFMLLGIITIHLLNIFRISTLVVLNKYSFPIKYHHELFNLVIYSFVFFAFYIWINHNNHEADKKLQRKVVE